MPQAAPPPKEGGAMKQGDIIVIVNPHLLPLGVPLALQSGARKTACVVITITMTLSRVVLSLTAVD